MRRLAVPWFITASTWSATTIAFPFGPGSCDSGGGVDGPHLTGVPGGLGSISNGLYEVRIDGKLLQQDEVEKVASGVDHTVELKVASAAAGSTVFRGFLLRLGGRNGDTVLETTQFLTPSSAIAQSLVYCECISVGSLAHTSNQDMVSASGKLNIPTISGPTWQHRFDLEVTVVKEASSVAGSSEWYYSKFTLKLETPTSPPTTSPTPSPSPAPTVAPSLSPTNRPSNRPSNRPTETPATLPPTVEPTSHPTYLPSNAPSFSVAPSTQLPSASVMPTLAGPSSFPSLNPSMLPTISESEDPSFRPSPAPSTAGPSFTPLISTPATNGTPRPSFSPSKSPTQFVAPMVSDGSTADIDKPVEFVSGAGSGSREGLSREAILTTTILLLSLLFVCSVGTVWIVYQKSKQESEEAADSVPSVIAMRPSGMSCSITNSHTTGTIISSQPTVQIDNMDLLRSSAASAARAHRAAMKSRRARSNTAASGESVSESSPTTDRPPRNPKLSPPADQQRKKSSTPNTPRTPVTAVTRQSISTRTARMSIC